MMTPSNPKTGPLIVPHASEDMVRRHEDIMSATTKTLEETVKALKETADQVHANNLTVARISGAVDTMAARVEGLSSRVTSVSQGITTLSESMEGLRESLTEDLREIRKTQKEDQRTQKEVGTQLAEYIAECRTYRELRVAEDKRADAARGIKVERHVEPGVEAPEPNGKTFLGSVFFAIKQPWFWAIFLGLAFGLGGKDLVETISKVVIEKMFHDDTPAVSSEIGGAGQNTFLEKYDRLPLESYK